MTDTSKTTNLDDLKNKLYEAFDSAMKRKNDCSTSQADAEFHSALAEIAKAVTLVEREQREAKQSGYGRPEKN